MAPAPTPDPKAAEFAGQLFFRLWRASHTRITESLGTIGLAPASFGLLNLLSERDGAIQQELGATMGIDPSTMVALIDSLEEAGLAKRRPHPTDRRKRAVSITAQGRRRLERGRRMAADVEQEVLRGLDKTERGELLSLLRKALDAAPSQPPWSGEEGD
jgi:DNA-binding MarR family transcriptional regulator